jgi:ribosomal protein S18 acetylase RimI-like enzyme
MEIRRATPDDATLLAALNRHVQDAHIAAEPQLYRTTQADDVSTWFLARLNGGDTGLIAHEGSEPLGYAIARLMERPAKVFTQPRRYLLLDQLAVVPGARRRGVGGALMRAVEGLALERGVDGVELDVRAANRDAIAFYDALGYRTELLHLRRRLTR